MGKQSRIRAARARMNETGREAAADARYGRHDEYPPGWFTLPAVEGRREMKACRPMHRRFAAVLGRACALSVEERSPRAWMQRARARLAKAA